MDEQQSSREEGRRLVMIGDSEFALRLEPNNQEIKEEYIEIKSLFEKEILQKASGSVRTYVEKTRKGGLETKISKHEVNSISRIAHKTSESTTQKGKNKGYNKTVKQELKASVQELASGAASRAIAEAAKNHTSKNSLSV